MAGSVLETFFIMFESDASDARQGVESLDQALNDTEESAQRATEKTALFSEGALQLSSASKNAAASLAGLSAQQVAEVSQIDNLRQLSAEVSALSDIDAIELGRKIGLDEKTIQTLRKGEQGVQELASSLQDIEDPADRAAAKFVEMGKSAAGAIAGIFALGSIVQGTLTKAADVDALGKFSRMIGENVGDVNAWEQAVIRSGGSADSFRASVESLTEKVVDASVKGTNEIVPFFNQLGISIVDANGKARSTLDLLPELAEAFEGISEQEAAGLGKKLGLDQGTILLLQSGRREVEALVARQKELGVVNEQAVEVSEKFNDQLADLKQVLGFTSQSLLISFLPAVTSVLEVFTDVAQWISQNQTLVEGFFIGIGLATLKFAIPPMVSLAIAVWAAIAPFLAIGLAIAAVGAAFALLYEDVVAFMNGQDSLIGQMAEKWPIVGDVVRGLVTWIQNYFTALKELASFLVDIFVAPTRALEKLKNIGGFIKDLLSFGGDDEDIDVNIKRLDQSLGGDGAARTAVQHGGNDEISESGHTQRVKPVVIDPVQMREAANAGLGPELKMVGQAQEAVGIAASAPLASQTSNSIQNSTNNNSRSISVQTGDTIIQTQATDPDGIASEAAGSLDRQLRTTVENFDDGVVI